MLYYNHDKKPVCCLRFCYFYPKRVWGMASFNAVIEHLHEVNLVSMMVRFAIALLGGGIIGMSRGKRQHAAGLRTHLLVCIGAASVMMTSLYQAQNLGVPGDAFRMPAQVVSGVGFLGAGSILVTGKRHVTGLTTAAGLWASACMGLAAGAGFYEGALMMCVLIYVVLVSLNKLDSTHVKASRVMNVYVELKSGVPLSALLRAVKSMGIQVNDIQDIGSRSAETHGYILELEIMRPELGHVEAAEQVAKIEQVEFCEEMKA